MSYIAKVNINNAAIPTLIGSTLYGICSTAASTAAKTVASPEQDDTGSKFINTHFTTFMQGATIHVKFTQGNTATQNITLAVGTTSAKDVIGMPICNSNTIISFTYDENEHWVVNDNVDTNTEYVFKTAYNASTNKAATEGDISSAITDLNLGSASQKGVVSDLSTNSTSTDVPTAAAVYSYIQRQTGGLAGLSGAMHFRGPVTDSNVTITNGGTQMPHIIGYDLDSQGSTVNDFTPEAGDVILYGAQEYVWNGEWVLLGDEGSYALKSNNVTVSFTQNTLPSLTLGGDTITANQKLVTSVTVADSNTDAASLTTNDYSIPYVTQAGTAMTASVSQGILTLTPGSNTTLGTPFAVKSVNQLIAQKMPSITVADSVVAWNAGSQASININGTKVVTTT